MARVFISAAFSLQMLSPEAAHRVEIYPMSVASVRHFWEDQVEVVSAVGHADTAAVVADMLGFEVPAQRISIHLEPGDLLIVAQLYGGRLPEGATSLPEGFDLRFVGVQVES